MQQQTLIKVDRTTTCCGAFTSIDEHGIEYCKKCYEPVVGFANEGAQR